jgi:membrane protein implicated in regulation of membrane protease activity
MDKFLDWLTTTFQQPLSLLFLALGAFLTFFGLSSAVNLGGANLTPDAHFRWLALAAGLAFCAVAVLFYYLPARGGARSQRKGEAEDITGRFSALLDKEGLVTSGTQKLILNIFATLPGNGLITQKDITEKIQKHIGKLEHASTDEIYYRLEQLRWMGFLTKRDSGPEYLYGLSAGYRRYLEGP